eukprot:2708618-Lingulodinium_polyedra.AAC.1
MHWARASRRIAARVRRGLSQAGNGELSEGQPSEAGEPGGEHAEPTGGVPPVWLRQRLGGLQTVGVPRVQRGGGGFAPQGPPARRGRPPVGARP